MVIGTRGSALARWQARFIADGLRACHPGLTLTERLIETEGDVFPHGSQPPSARAAVGIFVKRIEEALLAGEIDLAVHSLKDMPTEQPAGLTVAAVTERHDPRDALVSAEGWSLDRLPAGARVGTGSPRRRCQLLHHRPDLDVVPVRGNVDSRVGKLESGELEAVALALAGVERLGLDRFPARPLHPSVCLPAVGQGSLAVEVRTDDRRTTDLVATLDHPVSRIRARAERAFLRRLGGGCLAPATAYACVADDRLELEAVVGERDGRSLLLERERGEIAEAETIGTRLAERLLGAGAARILGEIRGDRAGGA